MSVAEKLTSVLDTLPEGVELVAISKYHPATMIQEAYNVGQRLFGENHVLEMAAKAEALPKDIRWHFTGHVQTNKIKYMAPFVDTVQSVDSMRVLKELDRHASRYGRIIRCLLQLHVAQEETKFGLTPDECRKLLETEPWRELEHVRIDGLMAMASNTSDENQIRKEFHQVHDFFCEVKARFFADEPHFRILSEGMTQDYPIAVSEGANMVRIGSAIFGERNP